MQTPSEIDREEALDPNTSTARLEGLFFHYPHELLANPVLPLLLLENPSWIVPLLARMLIFYQYICQTTGFALFNDHGIFTYEQGLRKRLRPTRASDPYQGHSLDWDRAQDLEGADYTYASGHDPNYLGLDSAIHERTWGTSESGRLEQGGWVEGSFRVGSAQLTHFFAKGAWGRGEL